MEYDNGVRIQLTDGELRYINHIGTSLLLTPTSEDELNSLLNEFPVNCGGNCYS